MSAHERAPLVRAVEREAWRAWLEANHAAAQGAWLLICRRADADVVGLDYETAVEEALCFGWVDSTSGRAEGGLRRLYFAPRRRRSLWAASNRARVERLMAAGRMAPAGLAAVERAKADGAWDILEQAERLEVADDLADVRRRSSACGRQLRRVPALDAANAPGLDRHRPSPGYPSHADHASGRSGCKG